MLQTLQNRKNRMERQGSLALSKRYFGLLMAFMLCLMGLGGLSACTSSPESGKEVIRLSSWGSAQEVKVLKTLLEDFEDTHPTIHVELLHIPDNYYQKLHILIAGDLAPDVMFTNSLSFPIYASQGVFLDLTPYLQAPKSGLSAQDFYGPALQAFTWKTSSGKTVLGALPRDISNVVVFYNQQLFKQAGLSPPPADWDWQTFLETAKTLTVDKNHDGDPDVFGVSFYSKPPLFWLPFVWSAGGDLFSPDLRSLQLNQPAALQGLQFYADLRNKWHVAPWKVESGGATMSQLFLQQKIAMMVSGRWSVPVLREQAKFPWDVAPFPKGPSGRSRVGIDASGYAISAKTPHRDASWALLQFLLRRSSVETVAASGLIVPARRDVAESPLFLEVGKAPHHGRVFLDVIPDGVPTHTPVRWNELSEALQLGLEPLWDGKVTAKQAVTAMMPTLQPLVEDRP